MEVNAPLPCINPFKGFSRDADSYSRLSVLFGLFILDKSAVSMNITSKSAVKNQLRSYLANQHLYITQDD
jgi:hypothetical protein